MQENQSSQNFHATCPLLNGTGSWGPQLQAEKHAVREVTTAVRKNLFPSTGLKEERMVRYRHPTAMKTLNRATLVQLWAKVSELLKKAKSAIKAKREEGKKRRKSVTHTHSLSSL